INLYTADLNNPTNLIDPTGLIPFLTVGGIKIHPWDKSPPSLEGDDREPAFLETPRFAGNHQRISSGKFNSELDGVTLVLAGLFGCSGKMLNKESDGKGTSVADCMKAHCPCDPSH